MKTKIPSATVDVDALVRSKLKPGVSISFWGAIKVDPAKLRVTRRAGEQSLRALDALLQKRRGTTTDG
jgi:hypothetical protein